MQNIEDCRSIKQKKEKKYLDLFVNFSFFVSCKDSKHALKPKIEVPLAL